MVSGNFLAVGTKNFTPSCIALYWLQLAHFGKDQVLP